MDLQLPGMSGVDATAALRVFDPAARVLIFSTFARDDEVQAALDAGALGYLQKSASRDELLAALQYVVRGVRSLPPEVDRRLAALRLGPAITPQASSGWSARAWLTMASTRSRPIVSMSRS
jgi:DNA-binding NarL/FixJ family response regulator